MVFSGDTLVEYHLDENELSIIKYEVTKEGFGNQEVLDGETGYYLILEGDEEEAGLCAPIEYLDDKHLYLRISRDRMLELKKKL